MNGQKSVWKWHQHRWNIWNVTLCLSKFSVDFTSLYLFGHSRHTFHVSEWKSCEKQTAQLFPRQSCRFSPCMRVKANVSRHIVADTVLCQLEIKHKPGKLKFHQQVHIFNSFLWSLKIIGSMSVKDGPKTSRFMSSLFVTFTLAPSDCSGVMSMIVSFCIT